MFVWYFVVQAYGFLLKKEKWRMSKAIGERNGWRKLCFGWCNGIRGFLVCQCFKRYNIYSGLFYDGQEGIKV